MTATGSRDVTSVTRGERLWRDMDGDQLGPAVRVLLEEACRIADRLDQLDRLLGADGETWLSIVAERGDPDRQTLVIDRALSEARQQATALKGLVAEIRAAGVEKPGKPAGNKGVPSSAPNVISFDAARSAKAPA